MAGTIPIHAPKEVTRRGVTAAEYFALDDDGLRHELIEGVLYVSPSPSYRHQGVASELARRLGNWAAEHGTGRVHCGPVDVPIDDDTVLIPDFVFVPSSHPQYRSNVQYLEPPPSLVCEVISPSSRTRDRKTKLRLYAKAGVPNYWIVDADARKIDAFTLQNGAYVPVAQSKAGRFSAPPFEELALDLTEVFAGL